MIVTLDEGGEGVALGVMMICVLVRGLVMGMAWEILTALAGDGGGEMRTAYEGRPRGCFGWKVLASGFIKIFPREPS